MSPRSDDDVRQRYGLAPEAQVRRARVGADGRVTLRPDSFTVATVPSALEWAVWDAPTVVAGTSATLSVRGRWVGEGAPVEVEVTDGRGRRVARAQAPMHRDGAAVEVPIPRDAEGLVVARARIADLGIDVTSGPLVVLPWIELAPRWERDGRAAESAPDGETVTLAVGVDARRDLLPDLEGASVRLAVAVGEPPEPVVELRGTVRDREVRVDWRASLPGARLDIARQALLDRAADRAGAARGEPPYRYDRPALAFTAELYAAAATSPPLELSDRLVLSVVDLATGTAAASRAVSLVWADGTVEDHTLDADGRLEIAEAPPGPVEVAVPPADGGGAPSDPPDPPPDADVVADVPVTPGQGHAALVPTGQHTHLRLLPFVLSP